MDRNRESTSVINREREREAEGEGERDRREREREREERRERERLRERESTFVCGDERDYRSTLLDLVPLLNGGGIKV